MIEITKKLIIYNGFNHDIRLVKLYSWTFFLFIIDSLNFTQEFYFSINSFLFRLGWPAPSM